MYDKGRRRQQRAKAKRRRTGAQAQPRSAVPLQRKHLLVYFHFSFERSPRFPKPPGCVPLLREAAAARLSQSTVYPRTLPIPLLCDAVPYICYITVTEQRAVFTCVAAGACHSCKVVKYACIKMSCVNRMNLGSLLRAPLFNQW